MNLASWFAGRIAKSVRRAIPLIASAGLLVCYPALGQVQYKAVRATVNCARPAGNIPIPLVGITVRLKNHVGGKDITAWTDASGKVTFKYLAYDLAPEMEVIYNGVVDTVGRSGKVHRSRLQVLNDGYSPRSDPLRQILIPGVVADGVLDVGSVEASSIDCMIWRMAVPVLRDYQSRMDEVPPAGGFRIVRRAAGLPEIPWTSYDTLELSSDVAWVNQCTMYHEFGHSVRHVLDGSQKHFADDVFIYIYGQEHGGNEITNAQHAFNEGVANYWESINSCAVTSSGNNVHWREGDIAARLRFLSSNVMVNGNPLGPQGVLALLRDNPGSIHTLQQFETALKHKYPQAPDPQPMAKCPTDYKNDGAFCRQDLTQVKPSLTRGAGTPLSACAAGSERSGLLCYPTCPAGFKGNGPVCWETCKSGYSDDGLTCRKGLDIYGKDKRGRGAGSPMTCGPGREQSGGLCYDQCPAGFSGQGPVCWGQCPAGTSDDGAVCGRVRSIVIADF